VDTTLVVSGRRSMLAWLLKRVRDDHIADEHRALRLVHEIFGPGVEDVTPLLEEPATAA
jgi:hypothetical protein